MAQSQSVCPTLFLMKILTLPIKNSSNMMQIGTVLEVHEELLLEELDLPSEQKLERKAQLNVTDKSFMFSHFC